MSSDGSSLHLSIFFVHVRTKEKVTNIAFITKIQQLGLYDAIILVCSKHTAFDQRLTI